MARNKQKPEEMSNEPTDDQLNAALDMTAEQAQREVELSRQTAERQEADGHSNGKPKRVESKAERFRRLALRRVPVLIKRMEHVRNLANRNQYERSESQTEKTLAVIKMAYDQLVAAFKDSKVDSESFSL